jgi:hypothetical protein
VWDEASALAFMDDAGIDVAITSSNSMQLLADEVIE